MNFFGVSGAQTGALLAAMFPFASLHIDLWSRGTWLALPLRPFGRRFCDGGLENKFVSRVFT